MSLRHRDRQRLAFAAALALGAAGCGEEAREPVTKTIPTERYSGEPQQRSWNDQTGDVRVIADDEGPPGRGALDLSRVTLGRAGDQMELTLRSADPPEAPMTQDLYILDTRSARAAATVVRHEPGGSARAVSRPADGTFEPVPVKVTGSTVVVRVPLTDLTRRGRFRWRVWVAAKGEIVDRVPSRASDYHFFPDER